MKHIHQMIVSLNIYNELSYPFDTNNQLIPNIILSIEYVNIRRLILFYS